MPMNSTNVGFFLVGGRSFLSRTATISPSFKNRMATLTPLGATAPVVQPSLVQDFALSQSGWLDDAVGQAHEALIGAGGRTSQVIVLSLEGNTLGATMIGASGAFSASYDKGVAVADFTKANVEYALSGRVDDMAAIIAPYAARTTAAHTEATPVDNLASSAAGGIGYLAVSDLTLGGATNLIVKLRHAAVATFADLLTFTAVTAAPNAQAVTCAGTVNRNLCISWAWTTAPGTSATFVVGFART